MGRTSDARERLIDSATELIYGRSYGAVGVNEICERAGVKKGSFYHFFPSKRDLTLAVLDAHSQAFQRRVLQPGFGKDVPPLERVRRLFELGYVRQRSGKEATGHTRGCPIGNLAVELSTQDKVIREKLQGIFLEWAALFKGALVDAVEAGELPEEVDLPRAAQALLAYLEGVLLLAKTNDDPGLLDRLAEGALGVVGAVGTGRPTDMAS